MTKPYPLALARGSRGEILDSNFSTNRSARNREIEQDRSPKELLAPRRYRPETRDAEA